ncbi:MAG: DUF3616 domain-containing protein [Pseudomonadota bacterium]|nr:DUF3616 domain-containing protein [Pseudomonadota bacterium]
MHFIHSVIVVFSTLLFANLSLANQIAKPINNHAWLFAEPLTIDNLNISGIVKTDDFMALASDEGNQVEIFKPDSKGIWQKHHLVTLSNNTYEIDLEALAWQKPYLYALGSHSAKRKKVKSSLSQKENINRLEKIYLEPARQQLFRIELNSKAKSVDIQSLSLTEELANHPILKSFIGIPSKENGIDIEGLAVDSKGRLLLGFRGPVLRGNIVPVLRLKIEKKRFAIKKLKTLFLTLSGNGVRGLSETKNQFLVLTGANGDQTTPYQVCLWNGEPELAGKDSNPSNLDLLCDLPGLKGKPEGIQFMKQTQGHIDFLIVQDGLKNGLALPFRCLLH